MSILYNGSLSLGPNEQVEVYSDSDPDHKFGTLETDSGWHLGFCRAADGLMINLDDDDSRDRVATAVYKRRDAQDAEYGGPEHDDGHTFMDWLVFIRKFHMRADEGVLNEDPAAYEDALVDIAALAFAALESLDRKKRAFENIKKMVQP